MSRRRSGSRRFLGTFSLGSEGDAVGDLRVRGPATSLDVHSTSPIGMIDRHATIHGRAYSGEHLTLIDCQRIGMTSGGPPGGPQRFSATMIPHAVAIGAQHFDAHTPCVASIHFSTTDLASLFHDFHAFGVIFDSKGMLDRMLKELAEDRAKEIGPEPLIGYFTGRSRIVTADTALGTVSVEHGVRHNFGGPAGIWLKNRLFVGIEPRVPVTLEAALEAMSDMGLFLSLTAGRAQGISNIRVLLAHHDPKRSPVQRLYMTYPWRLSSASATLRTHPADVPLQPVRNPEEYQRVLAHWLARQPDARIARHRYLSCLSKGNRFGPDRLITAANMFDLLPPSSVPASVQLPEELVQAREDCRRMFRTLPVSPERNSVLNALGHIGRASLPRKILHRVAMIAPFMGSRFPDLDWVAINAVKCRNAFVHGKSDDFDIEKAEPFVPFLTEALEFIFGASDLIESGWRAEHWLKDGSAGGHSFARFRDSYVQILAQLKAALGY